jgi:ABC-type sulfate/molybdate transport systems ATPase subunit
VETQPRVLTATRLELRRARRTIVTDVDLTLDRGEVVALLGPNGAGKSTLLHALAGLLPAASGTLTRAGRVAAALQAPALARRTVQANVEAALAWWGVPRAERRARALASLEMMGAGQHARTSAASLSGGEQRRVHLARVLAVEPDALLLDEPFAGLDATARADLLYDAASALRSPSRGTLVVIHDRSEAWALADRVMVLLGGRIAASGPTRDVLENPPDPEVAAFLGFSGRLEEDGAIRMVRPSHVVLDPQGPVTCSVTRRIPLEEGVRLELDAGRGRLVAIADHPGPSVGATVRARIEGGVRFAKGDVRSTISSA